MLQALVKGLLEKKPRQRLRIKDLRRDAWMTDGHNHPLPVAQHQAHHDMPHHTVQKGELKEILMEGMMQIRATKQLDRVSRNFAETGERFHEGVKQVVVTPRKEQKRPAPRGPGMLNRAA